MKRDNCGCVADDTSGAIMTRFDRAPLGKVMCGKHIALWRP